MLARACKGGTEFSGHNLEHHMPPRTRDTAPVKVKVDAVLKRRYAERMADLHEANAKGASAWQKRYESVAAIVEHDPPMYLAGGYATDQAFFEAELKETRQSVNRNIRIAKLATVEEIDTFGVGCLYLAIAYVEGKSGKPIEGAGSVDFAKLRISFEADGETVTKTLLACSRPELLEAVAQLPVNVAKPKKASPTAKAVGEAVKRSGVKGAKATVTKSLLVLRVPIDGIAAIGRELAAFKVPTS